MSVDFLKVEFSFTTSSVTFMELLNFFSSGWLFYEFERKKNEREFRVSFLISDVELFYIINFLILY